MADNNGGVRYVIEADNRPAIKATNEVNAANAKVGDSAVAAYGRAAKASDSFAASMVAMGKAAEAGFNAAGRGVDSFTRFVLKSGEALAATAIVVKSTAAALGLFATQATAAAGSGESLVNSYRAVRFALSPTIFTGVTLAMGIAVEETIRLTYSTGKLIEQRSALAARSGLDIKQVNELALASTLAGKANDYYFNSLKSLQRGAGTPGGQQALGTLGIFGVDQATPDTLARVGAAFEKIQDPMQRARIGVALFGDDFEKIQSRLDDRIGKSITKVRDFGAAIGPDQAQNIDLAKRNIESLGRVLEGTFDAASLNVQRLKNDLADFAATIINSTVADPRDINAARKPHPNSAHYGVFGVGVDPEVFSEGIENAKAGRLATESLTTLARGKFLGGVGAIESASRNAAALGVNLANPIIEGLKSTREGIESELGQYKARRDEAIRLLKLDDNGIASIPDKTAKIGRRQLTNTERAFYQQEVGSASYGINYDQRRLDGIANSHAAVEAQRSTARDALAAQSQNFGPLGKVFLDSQKLAESLSTRVDKEGSLQHFSLLPGTARNLDAIRAAELLTIQKSGLAEQQKGLEETYRLELGYDDRIFTSRLANEGRLLQAQIDNGVRLKESFIDQAGFERDERLRGLDEDAAQSVKQKVDLEKRKAGIEVDYQKQILATRLELYDDAFNRQFTAEKQSLEALGFRPDEVHSRLAPLIDQNNQGRNNIIIASDAQIAAARDNADTRSKQLQRDEQKRSFDSLKESAGGVLDALFTRTKSFATVLGDILKSAILTPIKEIASSEIAKYLFEFLHPGQSVSFDRSGGGSGRFGKFGDILGGFGLGTQPIFSTPGGGGIGGVTIPLTRGGFGNLDGLTGGTGPLAYGSSSLTGAQNFAASLPALLNLGFAGSGSSPSEQIGAGANTSGLPVLPSGLIDRTGTTSPLNGPLVTGGTAAALAGAAGLSYGTPATPGISGGLLGAVKSHIANLPSFFGFGANSVYGSGIYGTGITGALGTLATSPAAGLAGGILALNSLQRRPGAVSTIEGAGGGALLGAYLGAQSSIGGPGGALIGAGAGLTLGGIRTRGLTGALESTAGGALLGAGIGTFVLPGIGTAVGAGVGAAVGLGASLISDLFPSDRNQIKDQVKSLYHLTINNQIADQLIQMAKQSYGGSYSVAIRSKPALDLLSLYAQSTGQNFLFKNTPYPAYLTESGGTVYQQSQNIGGQAYSFGGAFGVANGVPTATIPTYVAGQQTIRAGGVTYPGLPSATATGTIQLDAAATTALLQGQAAQYIAGNPRDVASANAVAQQGSYDRRSSAARLLTPNLITSYA